MGLMGLSKVWMTTWPGVSCARAASSRERLAADGERRAVGVARIDEALGQQARTTCGLVVGRDKLAGGSQIADKRSAFGNGVEVVDGKLDAHLASDGEQVQDGVG